jgi:RNA polymerase sigma factor (sigma-70 family)
LPASARKPEPERRRTVTEPQETAPDRRIEADRRLVARSLAGDPDAFEELYRAHCDLVYGLCLRLCGDPREAATATQDTFVRAWQKLSRYGGRGALGAWLRKMAVNVVYDRKRAQSRRRRLIAPFPSLTNGANRNGGDEAVPGRRGMKASSPTSPPAQEVRVGMIDLERAVAALPAGARTVFVLHDVEGYRHREIAQLLGTSVGTSKAQLHRARRLLRVMLREDVS